MNKDFLIEIGCEELPPKALNSLIAAFADGIKQGLSTVNLSHGEITTFSAPRRLAVKVAALASIQPEQLIEKKGPVVATAFDKDGNPSPALLGFTRSANVDIKDLVEMDGPKGKVLGSRSKQPGKTASELLPAIAEAALKQLPIPKPMRWGAHNAQFVRPVHWLLMMHGTEVIPATILEQTSSNVTYGHRFHYPKAITVQAPDDYERALVTTGFVIANFAKRRDEIKKQIINVAHSLEAEAIIDDSLLEEVSNIVEWPVAMACRFDEAFLRVPQESLISSMQNHQKCFPLVRQGKLINHFITISNIQSKQPESVVTGNEKVMRARLADAAFFYDTDLEQPLDFYNEKLAKVTFQAKLGSLKDKAERVTKLAVYIAYKIDYIADKIDGDTNFAKRAGELCKADLMTNMVNEFPELQGIMGKYYALKYEEPREIADALEEQYWPKFAGDKLPITKTGQALSLADKIDTLVGIFGIGQKPTGSKDPFALRRAAIAIMRLIQECYLDLNLVKLIDQAIVAYGHILPNSAETKKSVLEFCFERLRALYQDQGISADVFEAVYAKQQNEPFDFNKRIIAVQKFKELPEAKNLIAANKRVYNILSKNARLDWLKHPNEQLFTLPEEKQLFAAIKMPIETAKAGKGGSYIQLLCDFAYLKEPVDHFFDNVMVMSENPDERENRLALLSWVREIFSQVADISKLQE